MDNQQSEIITYRDISTLHEWEHNPRTITKENFERLKKQIQSLGQYKPLLITEDGTVLGGNMRLKAYRELGITELWVSIVKADTEEKKIEYALSDNDRVGKYEEDELANLIGNYPDIKWDDYAVDIKPPTLVKDIMNQYKEVIEDEVPEISNEPAISKYGEVYQLGRHRLMCGDATKIEDVEKLMDGKKADMVFTDPPYNIDFQYNEFKDKRSKEDYLDNLINPAIENCITSSKSDISIYLWSSNNKLTDTLSIFKQNGIHFHQWLIWYKSTFGLLGNSDYQNNFEVMAYGYKGKHCFYNRGKVHLAAQQFIQETVDTMKVVHRARKPTKLCSEYILNSSEKEQIVLDVFGGTGSTLIACEQTNRICYMMEIDPLYCDVIRKRYAKFIGKEDEWQMITPSL